MNTRTRFEVFKRDGFTCQYCGRRSPDVVLEVDHIIPKSQGGLDDLVNLITSCWDCNRGKSDVPLLDVLTGEDPHDKAIALLERERQLREYNVVLAADRARREAEAWDLVAYWNIARGMPVDTPIKANDFSWLLATLKHCPAEVLRDFMDAATSRYEAWRFRDFKYVGGCVKRWRGERSSETEVAG